MSKANIALPYYFPFCIAIDNKMIKPIPSVITENVTIEIECQSSTKVKWLYEDPSKEESMNNGYESDDYDSLPSNVKENGNTLTIIKVTVKNKGYYKCVGTYYSIDSEKFLSRTLVTVKGMVV